MMPDRHRIQCPNSRVQIPWQLHGDRLAKCDYCGDLVPVGGTEREPRYAIHSVPIDVAAAMGMSE